MCFVFDRQGAEFFRKEAVPARAGVLNSGRHRETRLQVKLLRIVLS